MGTLIRLRTFMLLLGAGALLAGCDNAMNFASGAARTSSEIPLLGSDPNPGGPVQGSWILLEDPQDPGQQLLNPSCQNIANGNPCQALGGYCALENGQVLQCLYVVDGDDGQVACTALGCPVCNSFGCQTVDPRLIVRIGDDDDDEDDDDDSEECDRDGEGSSDDSSGSSDDSSSSNGSSGSSDDSSSPNGSSSSGASNNGDGTVTNGSSTGNVVISVGDDNSSDSPDDFSGSSDDSSSSNGSSSSGASNNGEGTVTNGSTALPGVIVVGGSDGAGGQTISIPNIGGAPTDTALRGVPIAGGTSDMRAVEHLCVDASILASAVHSPLSGDSGCTASSAPGDLRLLPGGYEMSHMTY